MNIHLQEHLDLRLRFISAIAILCITTILLLFHAVERRPQVLLDKNTTVDRAAYTIFIEIEDKTLYLLFGEKCIKQYPISSGKSGMPSPIGYWKIIEKENWGEGFGGRWMGLNVPWGTFPEHGNSYDYYHAAHGFLNL